MLLVEAYYTCKPGKRPELLEIVKPNIEGTRKEPGNISYMHYPDPNNENNMFVFEKWESLSFQQSLQDQSTTRHSARRASAP